MLKVKKQNLIAEGRRKNIEILKGMARTRATRMEQVIDCCLLIQKCCLMNSEKKEQLGHSCPRECQSFLSNILDQINQDLRGLETQSLKNIVTDHGLAEFLYQLRRYMEGEEEKFQFEQISHIQLKLNKWKRIQNTILRIYCTFSSHSQVFQLFQEEAITLMAEMVGSNLRIFSSNDSNLLNQCLIGLSNLLSQANFAQETYRHLNQANFQQQVVHILKNKNCVEINIILAESLDFIQLLASYLRFQSSSKAKQQNPIFHKIIHSHMVEKMTEWKIEQCKFKEYKEQWVIYLEISTYLLLSRAEAEYFIIKSKQIIIQEFIDCAWYIAVEYSLGMELFEEKDLKQMCQYALSLQSEKKDIFLENMLQLWIILLKNSLNIQQQMKKLIIGIELAGCQSLILYNDCLSQKDRKANKEFVQLVEIHSSYKFQ